MTSSLAQSSAHASLPSREQVDAALDELARILTSDSFSSSKRCRDFLEFVVKRALAGDADSLTERFLGVELFGRAVDYETATDSIVRVRANDVRRRLAQYYSSQRSATPVRIDLMAGGYIPEFHWKLQETPAQLNSALPSPIDRPPISIQEDQPHIATSEESVGQHAKVPARARLFWGSGAVALIAAAVWMTLALRPHTTNFDRFWQPILDAPPPPVVSLPTTDTFQFQPHAMQQFSRLKPGESVSLGLGDVQIFHNWHVSLPVLQATLSVTLALERKGKTPLVRQGTDLKMDELRGHPIIAIGSFSNPWTQQNVAGLRFTFDRGDSDSGPPRIRDAFNPQRSWSLPRTYPEPQAKDYAIVTRTFDPVTHEPFLSLAGLHSFGNQIAGEFVSQESSWNEVAARAPAGWEKKNLQVVLETNLVGTTTSSPKIVDVYFW